MILSSLLANVLTQTLLWIILNTFYRHYLIALFTAEVLIWFLESLLLWSIKANRLSFREAMTLSLAMNLTSFAVGWFLPV